ncbi:MAG TPA: histidine phosphatase family protein, partial [Cryptosporangiaceae bacterium]|nr:histidine phosphatase family protein [Cryptosporangiaceae bacterium]
PVSSAPAPSAPARSAPARSAPARSAPVAGGTPGWASGTLAASRATTTVLVRHAASALSPERRFSGRGDVPLSPDGVEQTKRVATRLAARGGLSAVVSSPLLRARQTAELVAGALGVDLTFDPDLVETDFGVWEGSTFAEVRERWPDELDAWLAAPGAAPPGGESFAEVEHRVLRAHRRLVETYPAAAVVVVSHVTPLKTLLRLALEAPVATLFRLQLDVTGVSEVDWYPDGPASVRLVNDTHHLTG